MIDDLFQWLSRDDEKLPYVMTGKVLANFSPLHPACVMVSLPERLVGLNVTAWARVAMPFAGSGKGSYGMPDIGDEVVIAFCNGEIDRPVVIGSLYSPLNLPPMEAMTLLNNVKMTKTSAGNTLKMDDLQGIELKSVSKLSIKFDDMQNVLTLKDLSGQTSVKIDGKAGKVTVEGLSTVALKAGTCEVTLDNKSQSVTVKGLKVNIEATQGLTLKGAQVKIDGQQTEVKGQQTKVTGQMLNVEAGGQLELKSSGIANLKGSMVKIN